MSKQDTVTGNTAGENRCFYYLHSNGDLIHKSKHNDTQDFEESPFVKRYWLIDLNNRADAYHFLIAASMEGARKDRIQELILHWKITDDDAKIFCERAGLQHTQLKGQFAVHPPEFTNAQDEVCGRGSSLFEAVCDFYAHEVNDY